MAPSLDLTRRPTRLHQLYHEPRPDLGITNGDCVRTAIAMILGLPSPEEVPHSAFWDEIDAWLKNRGCHLVWFPLPCRTPECVNEHLPTYLRACPALLTGTTRDGHRHCVAVIDGEPVDTVGWSAGLPLAGPDTDGVFWIAIIVPMRA